MSKLSAWRIDISDVRAPELPPLSEVRRPPIPPLQQSHPEFPFENLAFEGGGTKGLAYVGALQVLEERGIYPQHIHRASGTSSGSFMAAMVALGMESKVLLDLLYGTDFSEIMQDARLWPFGAAYNLMTVYGLNPGRRLLEFLGELLEEYTGSPDSSFRQVHERSGRELCVPICNLTRMTTEYCHPKTTPDMPVRLAVAISMSLPVMMRPYRIRRHIGDDAGLSEEDLYTDGGLLCNFPLHVFDGWWLSLAPEDGFLHRLRPIEEAPRLLQERFVPRDERTLGFTVFDRTEDDVTRMWALAKAPGRPNTTLAEQRNAEDAELAKKHELSRELESAVIRVMDALAKIETNGDGKVDRNEAEELFSRGGLTEHDAALVFGSTDVHAIFDQLDRNKDGHISFGELQKFMDSHSVDLTARAFGGRRSQMNSMGSFVSGLFNTMLMHIRQLNLHHEDRWRTVAIDTDYVGTADFDLEDPDRAFLVECGRNSVDEFLKAWKEHDQE